MTGSAAGLKVLVVTTVHRPLDARIHHRQLRALVAADVQVTYVAPFRDTGTPPGAVVAGIEVVNVPRAVGRRRGLALRLARRIIGQLGPAHDLVLLHDPELVLAVLGRLRRLPPVVLDVHEDLPASLGDRSWIASPVRPVAVRAAAWLERLAERRLAGLLLAEPSYQGRFARPHPVVPNLPWLPATTLPAGTRDRVVYLGRLSTGRGARELITLGWKLADHPGAPQLELIGHADDDVAPLLAQAERDGVLTWHGFVPNLRALELVAGAVAGLAPLHDLPNYRGSMPTKVVEYLGLGVPAVVTPLPEAVALVEAADAGVVVPFGDVDAMAAAVLALASNAAHREQLGRNGRAHVAAQLSWDAVAPRFVAHLGAVAGAPTPPASQQRRPPEPGHPPHGDPPDRVTFDVGLAQPVQEAPQRRPTPSW